MTPDPGTPHPGGAVDPLDAPDPLDPRPLDVAVTDSTTINLYGVDALVELPRGAFKAA